MPGLAWVWIRWYICPGVMLSQPFVSKPCKRMKIIWEVSQNFLARFPTPTHTQVCKKQKYSDGGIFGMFISSSHTHSQVWWSSFWKVCKLLSNADLLLWCTSSSRKTHLCSSRWAKARNENKSLSLCCTRLCKPIEWTQGGPELTWWCALHNAYSDHRSVTIWVHSYFLFGCRLLEWIRWIFPVSHHWSWYADFFILSSSCFEGFFFVVLLHATTGGMRVSLGTRVTLVEYCRDSVCLPISLIKLSKKVESLNKVTCLLKLNAINH